MLIRISLKLSEYLKTYLRSCALFKVFTLCVCTPGYEGYDEERRSQKGVKSFADRDDGDNLIYQPAIVIKLKFPKGNSILFLRYQVKF